MVIKFEETCFWCMNSAGRKIHCDDCATTGRHNFQALAFSGGLLAAPTKRDFASWVREDFRVWSEEHED